MCAYATYCPIIALLSAEIDNSFLLYRRIDIVTFNEVRNTGRKGRVRSGRYLGTKETNYDFDVKARRIKEEKNITGGLKKKLRRRFRETKDP